MPRPNFVEIDLTGVASKQELHEALARALAFPGWYGRNWNAFWDAITGLVEMPVSLRLKGWGQLMTQLPDEARHLRESLAEMASKYPDLAARVVYA